MKKIFTLLAAIVLLSGAALADTINVAGHNVQKTQGTDDGGNWVQYIFTTEIGGFYFCFYADGTATDIVTDSTYTYAEMDAAYCAYVISQSEYYEYTEATFTKLSETEFEATVTCTNGNTYNIAIAPLQPIYNPIDTVVVDFNSRIYNRLTDATDQGVFQLVGQNAEYAMYFAVYSNAVPGTYTADDIYADYTAFYRTDTQAEIELNNLLGDVTVAQNDGITTATINWVGTDSVLYVLNYVYSNPTAATEVTIDGTLTITKDANYDLYLQYYGVYAYDFSIPGSVYNVQGIVLNTEDNPYGTFDISSGYMQLAISDSENEYESYTAELTFANNGGSTATLTGSSLVYGDINFTFNCTGEGPTSGINTVEASNYHVYTMGGSIMLKGAEGQQAFVYDMTGRLISDSKVDSDNARIEVPATGVYMVRVNGQTLRVVVK